MTRREVRAPLLFAVAAWAAYATVLLEAARAATGRG